MFETNAEKQEQRLLKRVPIILAKGKKDLYNKKNLNNEEIEKDFRRSIKDTKLKITIKAEALVRTHRSPMLPNLVSVNSYVLCLIDSEGLILLVSSIPSGSNNPYVLSSSGIPEL